jgi:endonuclease VIII
VPEGDTIHKTARRLRDALAGHKVVRFELRRDPRGLRPPAAGAHVTNVEAHGKHLLVAFDDGATLHTHMQMTGAWHVYRAGERWRRAAHRARVVLEVDDGTTAVCFDAPVAELQRSGRIAPSTRAGRALQRLGPDLCDADIDLNVVLGNLAALDPATEIAVALLDQHVASGLGNVFKSEVCWACRVHPSTPLAELDERARRSLVETAHRFLLANVDTPRRTTYRGGLAVYGRAGRPCPRCRTLIRRAPLGDPPRSTYWCPRCQPERDGRSSTSR